MLNQYAMEKFTPSKVDMALKHMEDFEQLPLHFLNFYGSTPPEMIFNSIEHAVFQHDIGLICIDNMQFMLSD